jgi:adenylylsulfate kinase
MAFDPKNAEMRRRETSQQRIDSHLFLERGLAVWLTGLSGAGKTTICNAVYQELLSLDISAEVLDGDVVRKNLCRDLGFTKADRDENIRRIGAIADVLTSSGIIVLVAAISPYRSVREEIRRNIGTFLEVYVNAPLEICEARDVKGLYKRAHSGEISGFTGIDAPYEPPVSPDVQCDTHQESIEESVSKVIAAISDWLQSH